MFTGLVEGTGKIQAVSSRRAGKKVTIIPSFELSLKLGDSIAVDGACLTVEALSESESFTVFMSDETLKRTKFGRVLRVGQFVNLETPITAEKPFGGHFVTGHVDTVGKLKNMRRCGDSVIWEIHVPEREFMKYVVEKGSVAVDGVSLTVTKVTPSSFEIALIPYTLEHTTFKDRKIGDLLNLEFDIIGKYVERFLKAAGKI